MHFGKCLVAVLVSLGAFALSACSSDEGSSPKKEPSESPSGTGGGDANGKKTDSRTTKGTPTRTEGDKTLDPKGETALSCETKWTEFVQQNDAGEFTLYRMTTTFAMGGETRTMVMTTRQTVLEASPEAVTTKTEVKSDFQDTESTDTTTKQEFLASCGEAPVPPIEKGTERVTVPAGTFDTEWVRTKATDAGLEGTSTVWFTTLSSGESLMVKMLSEAAASGDEGLRSMLNELVETNKR